MAEASSSPAHRQTQSEQPHALTKATSDIALMTGSMCFTLSFRSAGSKRAARCVISKCLRDANAPQTRKRLNASKLTDAVPFQLQWARGGARPCLPPRP